MSSQAGSGYLEGRSSASWEAARRHDVARRSPSYRRPFREGLSRRRRHSVVRLQTSGRNRALRDVIGAAGQTLGYIALTAVVVLLAFAYVP